MTANSGPFQIGDQVQLTDPKGKMHTITLAEGDAFHTAKGKIGHDELIGSPEGCVVVSGNGTPYLALRPLLQDFVLSMPRGAAIIYPKDAALIVGLADIRPGARVLEAGAGSGGLTTWLLRGVGPEGRVTSVEKRPDFAEIAGRNVGKFFGGTPANWDLRVGALEEVAPDGPFDRVVLDMLAPWELIEYVSGAIEPGGVLCCYVATTTQLSRVVETLRADGGWTEPRSLETMLRTWHVEGLAVRPDHRMQGHTGFLTFSRKLAPGTTAPARRTRPSKGSYGEDYSGPRRGDAAPLTTGNPAADG